MENNNKTKSPTVEDIVATLLDKIGVEAKVESGFIGDTATFTIRTKEAGLLIGDEGQSLFALNYLTKKIAEKHFYGDALHFIIDVNDYQRKKFEELRDQARMGAQRVRYFKKEVVLNPMTAFERRLVHLTLQEYPDITTESTGAGGDRQVVIKPYP